MKYLSLLLAIFICSCQQNTTPEKKDQNSTDTTKQSTVKETPKPVDNYVFELKLTKEEKSKDSHRHIVIYRLEADTLSKTITHYGRPQKMKLPNMKAALDQIRIQQLKSLIAKMELNQNYEKSYPLKLDGIILNYETVFKTPEFKVRANGGLESENDAYTLKMKEFEAILDLLLSGNATLLEIKLK